MSTRLIAPLKTMFDHLAGSSNIMLHRNVDRLAGLLIQVLAF